MLVIIHSGLGNIGSLCNMLAKIGCQAKLGVNATDIEQASHLILPGVGAFDQGMQALHKNGLVEALNEAVLTRNIPILGICLGMQLMCQSSEEGSLPGLGWIDAEIKRFNPTSERQFKVPHTGWNKVKVRKANSIIPADDQEQRFYFVHSYHVVCHQEDDVLATTSYGHDFVSAFVSKNMWGVQFHPEKSHRFGMALMKNFVEKVC